MQSKSNGNHLVCISDTTMKQKTVRNYPKTTEFKRIVKKQKSL